MSEPRREASMNAKVASGVSWSFAEKMLTEAVNFFLSILLARLLLPEAYGVVGLIQVFITICQVFVNNGLGTSVVQKKDPDRLDFSTVFVANVTLSLGLYAVLFFLAPVVALFYEMPQLSSMLRILALKIPISGVYNIQLSYVQKNMQFKKMFFSSLGGTLFSGVLGVFLAYRGFGAWALILSALADLLMDSIVLFFSTRWCPALRFSKERFRSLNRFSWKVMASELVNRLYEQLRLLVIGKAYTASDLAYNSKGQKFPLQIVETVNTTIIRVMFPALSHYQNDKDKLVELSSRSVRYTSFFLCPLMMGMAACANQLIPWMLTEAWNDCIPYLQLYCLTYLFHPIQSVNVKVIQALGRSDISLKLEIVKKVLGLTALVGAIVIFNSPVAVAASFSVMSFGALFLNAWPCKKLLGYGIGRELLDFLPSFLLSLVMGAVVMLLPLLKLSYFATLMLQIAVGALVYALLAWVFGLEQFTYLVNFVKGKGKRKKGASRKSTPSGESLSSCTGCGACAAVCSVGALRMQRDSEGFLYPVLEKDKCVSCGRCEKVCSLKDPPRPKEYAVAYSAYAEDEADRREGSSGGVMGLMSRRILAEGGTVFGAVYDPAQHRVRHAGTDRVPPQRLARSKYVQSTMGDSYARVKALLKQQTPVLFCGTPCQVAGLKRYLGEDPPHLYTVDFFCHGVPSPALFEDMLEDEGKQGAPITDLSFREKAHGWRKLYLRLYREDGSVTEYPSAEHPYYFFFLKNYSLRASCYDCSLFEAHEADLTLADFWHMDPGEDDDKGVSLVIPGSDKGKELLESTEGLCLRELPAPPDKERYRHGYDPARRERFLDCYRRQGYQGLKTELFPKEQAELARLSQRAGRGGLPGIIKKIIRKLYHKR